MKINGMNMNKKNKNTNRQENKEITPDTKKEKNKTESATPVQLTVPKDKLVFLPLGGIGEIGMNFYLYQYKGKWLIVDLGIGFAGDEMPGVEVLLPDPSFIEKHKKDIVGLIITHAHEDHIGGVSYLWRYLNCPIYLSPFAAAMLETKLDEMALTKRVDINIIRKGDILNLAPFTIEVIGMTHSIPEPAALAITTDKGTVLHTGDWKFEENALLDESYDIESLKRIGKKGVLALICDSTNVFNEASHYNERDVRESLTEIISHYTKHVLITCFSSNVARIESIAAAAEKNHRKVCLLGRSLRRVNEAARSSGYLYNTPEFISEDEAEDLNPNEVLYICTGSQGEQRSGLYQLTGQGLHYPKISKGDVVIFSSRVIPGNEYQISKLQNRILAMGAEVITEKDALVHVSGHPSKADMKRLYKIINPQIAVPMHGDLSHLLEHEKLAKECRVPFTFVIKNGDLVQLDKDDPKVLGIAETGILVADGKRLLSIGEDIFKKRRKIMESGSAVVTVVIDKHFRVVGNPIVSSFDLFDKVNDASDVEQLSEAIKLAVEDMEKSRRNNDEAIKDTVKVALRRKLEFEYGKKPIVNVHLVRL